MRFGWLRRLSQWVVSLLGVAWAAWGLAAMWDGWDKIQIERGWSLFIAGSMAASGGLVTLAIAAATSRLELSLLAAREKEPARQPAQAVQRKEAGERKEPVAARKEAPLDRNRPIPEQNEAFVERREPIEERSEIIAEREPILERNEAAPEPKRDLAADRKEPTLDRREPIGDRKEKFAPRRDLAADWKAPVEERAEPSAQRSEPTEAETPRTARAGVPPPKAKKRDELVEVDRHVTGGATYVMFSDGSVEVRGPKGTRRYSSLSELKAKVAQGE